MTREKETALEILKNSCDLIKGIWKDMYRGYKYTTR